MQHVKDEFAYEEKIGEEFLLVGDDLVQSCIILALTAVFDSGGLIILLSHTVMVLDFS